MSSCYSYENDKFRCNSCGWTGLEKNCLRSEFFNDCFGLDCPISKENIIYINFSMVSEMTNSNDAADKATAAYIKNLQNKFKAEV